MAGRRGLQCNSKFGGLPVVFSCDQMFGLLCCIVSSFLPRALSATVHAAALQPLTSCYTYPGASGSSVFDLGDYKAIGVVSGRPSDNTSYSRWTPLTAQHFGALERWRYQGGVVAPLPPAPPSPPPPPPLNYTRYACECVRPVMHGMQR